MITPTLRSGRGLASSLVLLLFVALAGCAATRASGTGSQEGQAARPVDPEQVRLESAPAAEREALAAAQRGAEAAADQVAPARRLVERRTLELRLADEERSAAAAFAKAAKVRAEIAQKFGADSGLERAPVLTLLERAELAARQADLRAKLAQYRYDHAAAMVPVVQAKTEVARRQVEVARQRALAATRPGVESVAFPPLADAQAALARGEADLARAQAGAVRRQADVETTEYALNRLGAPVALTAIPGTGTWPALAIPAGPASQTAAPAPVRPAPAAARPTTEPAAAAPALTEPTQTGGAVLFEPASPASKPR